MMNGYPDPQIRHHPCTRKGTGGIAVFFQYVISRPDGYGQNKKVAGGSPSFSPCFLVFLGLVVAGCAHWPNISRPPSAGLRGRIRQNETNEPSVSSSRRSTRSPALCGDVRLQTVALATLPADEPKSMSAAEPSITYLFSQNDDPQTRRSTGLPPRGISIQ